MQSKTLQSYCQRLVCHYHAYLQIHDLSRAGDVMKMIDFDKRYFNCRIFCSTS